MSIESKNIKITIPSWVFLFFLALPLYMEWEDGFFSGLATVICWTITIFFVCTTTALVLISSHANAKFTKKTEQPSNTFFQVFQMMIVAVLMYLLGHTVLAGVFVFCVVFSFLIVKMVKNKINHQ